MKIWTGTQKGDDKIIAFTGETICKGNPPAADVDHVLFELKTQQVISKSLAGFPLNYIQQINMPEGKNYIELFFAKDSYELLKVNDDTAKNEIFEYLKANIPATYTLHQPTFIEAGKKPLIASVVVAILFTWTLYLAVQIEAGNQYYIVGDKYNSITGIVLAIAEIGVLNVILLFGALLVIAIFMIIKKGRSRTAVKKLTLRS